MVHIEHSDYRPAPATLIDGMRKVFARRNAEEMRAGEWVYARNKRDGEPGKELFKPRSGAELR